MFDPFEVWLVPPADIGIAPEYVMAIDGVVVAVDVVTVNPVGTDADTDVTVPFVAGDCHDADVPFDVKIVPDVPIELKVIASVPDDVTGEFVIVKIDGADNPTDVTVPAELGVIHDVEPVPEVDNT